jgi:carbonic anhydrase
MSSATTDQLLANAESYAASFDKGELPLPPARKVAVLACMDARLNPYGLLGLREGDAHVIRNAGGVVTDEDVRQSIARIEASPFIPHKNVRGFVYDVHTGALREVR